MSISRPIVLPAGTVIPGLNGNSQTSKKPTKAPKYHNQKTVRNGITFDSVKEADRYDKFVRGLQDLLEDGEGVVIVESGHDKLRYVVGVSTVITKDRVITFDLAEISAEKLRDALGDPDLVIDCDY